jgi:hypothetical protein
MENIFERLCEIAQSSSQKEKFAIAANRLLNQCFILKNKDDTKRDFYYIKDNFDLFCSYFDLLGYDIKINEDLGLVSAMNRNGTGRLQFTKAESIMFLILKLLYLEKRRDIASYMGQAVASIQELRDKYAVLKTKKLDKSTEKEAFMLFKRYNLIRNLSPDLSDGNTRIEIYPSILVAVPNEGISSLYESIKDKLNQYDERDDTENSDEEAE